MTAPADDLTSFTATADALVLASVSSPAELELLSDWLARQRREHPDARVEVLQLPAEDPPPAVLAQLVEKLEADDDRSMALSSLIEGEATHAILGAQREDWDGTKIGATGDIWLSRLVGVGFSTPRTGLAGM